jgi:hypothetical protein
VDSGHPLCGSLAYEGETHGSADTMRQLVQFQPAPFERSAAWGDSVSRVAPACPEERKGSHESLVCEVAAHVVSYWRDYRWMVRSKW